ALVVRGNGDSYWFPLSAGVYSHAAGDSSYSRLEKLANNTFALTSKYGIVSHFSTTGLLTSRVDSNSNTTSFAYSGKDSDGLVDELLSITDPFGRVITFGYTGSKVTSITHFSGKITALAYTANNLTSYTLTDPDPTDSVVAPQVSFVYLSNSLGRTDAVNQTTTYNFNASDGRLRSVSFPDATSWEIIPSEVIGLATASSGNALATPADAVAKVTDQREIAMVANASQRKTWQFRTDRFGGIIQSTTALGFVREYQRDKDGLVHTFIEPDPDGPNNPLVSPKTYVGYNSSGDATYYQAADGGTSRTAYTLDLHRPIRTKDPLGNTQSLIYDSRGNLVASVDGSGFITQIIVNSRGLTTRISVPDPDGNGPLTAPVTNFAYNTYGMLSTLTNPDGSTKTFTYNSAGQLLTYVDELGKTTTLTYDPLGRPKTQTNRVGAVTQWQYDSASYLRQEIDPVGNITDITYDPLGRTDTITFPDPDGVGSLTRPVNNIEYDPNGNVSFEGDSRGNFTGQIPYT
ncbi:MAG: RHS repeat protein, partial [Planctomycetales bacterium]|nr:RHS repeat protein [Planctomycetales bacterium]